MLLVENGCERLVRLVRFSEVENSWERLVELDKEKVMKVCKRLRDFWRCWERWEMKGEVEEVGLCWEKF